MSNYQEQRLQELRAMTTEEVAACKIRSTTPPRVKEMILRARRKADSSAASRRLPPASLQDGDVLLKRSSGSVANRIISGFTGSPYTHAALYSKGKVYDSLGKIGSAERKNVKIGGNINSVDDFLEREKGLTYDVFRPKNKEAVREVRRNAERATRNTKGYSNASLVQAGLRDRFGFGITTNYDKNFKICSELVYDCFNGTIGNDVSSSVSPGRIAKNQNLEKVHTLRLSLERIQESGERSQEETLQSQDRDFKLLYALSLLLTPDS
jgi:hypothetical protein